MGDFGIQFTDAEFRAVYTPSWCKMYEAFGLPRQAWAEADQRWLHHYQGEEPDLLPGVSGMLAALRERRFRLGIVSNGTRSRIERELVRLGLDGAFQALVCHEDVICQKPHAEGLHKALALADSSPDACCYVGDTPEDIQMGRNAGVFTVGVLSEYVERRRLEECRPDLLLKSIDELPRALTA